MLRPPQTIGVHDTDQHRILWQLCALTLALGLAACGAEPEPPALPTEPALQLQPITFDDIEGWQQDDPSAAVAAFSRSCAKLAARPDSEQMAGNPTMALFAGTLEAWRGACAAAVPPASPEQARAFFEDWFQPYRVSDRGDEQGLFTGYYEPLLYGSRHFGAPYTVPLHRAPQDMIRVDLGSFKPELAGETITGRVDDRQFVPYYARADIDAGALEGRELELVWVSDPVAKFFLQIQGSGQIQLDDGSRIRVGYADQNGRAYRAIGRDLVEMGEMTIDQVSLQSIRDWLTANPAQAGSVMARNGSYVFFDERTGLDPADGPIGAQGVPLTAGRSLAVDRRYITLGTPVWLDTTAPWPEGEGPLRRVMVAQDTGGAIRGPVRGDVFWGTGESAEAVAGRMRSQGRYVVLLPREATPTS